MENSDLAQILRSFRENLPDASKTAQAIDQGAGLADISAYAQEEGVHQLASILFEAQQENLKEQPAVDMTEEIVATITARTQELRQQLPDSCETAQAIDRRASLEEISECAETEGMHMLASTLFEAEQAQLHG